MIRFIKYLTICILPCYLNAIDWVGSYTCQGSTLYAVRPDVNSNAIWLRVGDEISELQVLGTDDANRLVLRAKDGSIIKLSFATALTEIKKQEIPKDEALSILRKRFIDVKPARVEHNVDSLLNDPTYPAEYKKRIRDAIDRAHKKAEAIATRVASSDETTPTDTTTNKKQAHTEYDLQKPLLSEFIPPNKSDFDPALTKNLSDADWASFWLQYVQSRQEAQGSDSKTRVTSAGSQKP